MRQPLLLQVANGKIVPFSRLKTYDLNACKLQRVKECDCLPFNDGEHIIYVNGKVKASDTALGRLMNDFFCTDAKDMHYKELSDKVRYYKETEEGVETMCKAMDDLREEVRIDNARKMLANGKFTLEDIVECSGLPLEKVKELAEDKPA